MINEKEFDLLAGKVIDAYPDFKNGLYLCAKKSGCVNEVYDFMQQNQNATTSDILMFIDNALGNPAPMKIRSTVRSNKKPANSKEFVAV